MSQLSLEAMDTHTRVGSMRPACAVHVEHANNLFFVFVGPSCHQASAVCSGAQFVVTAGKVWLKHAADAGWT